MKMVREKVYVGKHVKKVKIQKTGQELEVKDGYVEIERPEPLTENITLELDHGGKYPALFIILRTFDARELKIRHELPEALNT